MEKYLMNNGWRYSQQSERWKNKLQPQLEIALYDGMAIVVKKDIQNADNVKQLEKILSSYK